MKSVLSSLFAMPMLAVAACSNAPATAAPEAHIPARMLRCTLGHALNLDPAKNQTMADIRYEGTFDFALFLPAANARKTPPPNLMEAPDPVDPATRVVADPSGLRRSVPPGFARVVDLWPERVELTQVVKGSLVHFIVINQIDEARGTANLFMTTATDVAAMNLQTVYQGPCRVAVNLAARQGAR